MNSLLMIIGMLALSNGNISLLNDNNRGNFTNYPKAKTMNRKSPSKNSKVKIEKQPDENNKTRSPKTKRVKKKVKRKITNDDIFKFNLNDINQGLKMIDLSDEDLDRGMEIITRTKKYMSGDEKKVLVKLESMLDLVRGIKKLSSVDFLDEDYESDFFRTMEEDDKKNMMIKEILEVFPEKRKESIEKALDMKKKIDLFAELFLPDDIGEGGFSLGSLANINNLGSLGNLSLIGNLLRGDSENSGHNNDVDEYYKEEDIEYDDMENLDRYYDLYEDYEYDDIEKTDKYINDNI